MSLVLGEDAVRTPSRILPPFNNNNNTVIGNQLHSWSRSRKLLKQEHADYCYSQ